MSEIQYKFKSNLNFETISLSESFITVGELKERINKKQSIKTNGFDLKFKDSEGRVYSGDDEIIDPKFKIIVSRCPKVVKPLVNTRKKDICPVNKLNDDVHSTNAVVVQINTQVSEIKDVADCSVKIECPVIHNSDNVMAPKLPDYLKCTLCNNIMKDAMKINCCKKSFCYECITGYLFDPDISGAMECPDCKSTVSNCGSNLIENFKIRDLVYKFQNGILDTTSHEFLEIDDNNIQQEDINCIVDKDENICFNPEDNPQEDTLINEISNLYKDTNINRMSTESDILEFNDGFECQNQTHSIEEPILDSLPENKILFQDEVIQLDEVMEKQNIIEVNVKEQQSTKSSSQKKSSSKVNPITTDSKVDSNNKNTNNQSIKDLDFDPVLYMKFLKIVGESYPEELKQILSNNIEKSHRRKDPERSSSSKAQHRSRDDEYHDNKPPPQKKHRKENVVENEDNRYKKNYDNSNRKREIHLDNRGYYDDDHRRGGLVIVPQGREQYSRNSNEVSEMKSNRLREMEPPRSKEYYPQHNSSRYIRSQFDAQPSQFYDDRRRFKTDHCSTSYQSDKPKFNRRSDR